MEDRLTRYEISICECVNGPHLDHEPVMDGDWVRWEDVETLLNTRTADPLLEKMAEALEAISLYESCHGDNWPARIAKQALQEYREMKDAK